MKQEVYDVVKSMNSEHTPINLLSKIIVWDEATECVASCPIHDRCKSKSVNIDTGEFNPCALRQKFSNYVAKTLIRCIPKATDLDYHKIGVLMLPVYAQLMDYQILLNYYKRDMVENFKIVESINRAVRDISKTLMLSLKDVSGDGDGPNSKSRVLEGDPEYYDSLIKKTTA